MGKGSSHRKEIPRLNVKPAQRFPFKIPNSEPNVIESTTELSRDLIMQEIQFFYARRRSREDTENRKIRKGNRRSANRPNQKKPTHIRRFRQDLMEKVMKTQMMRGEKLSNMASIEIEILEKYLHDRKEKMKEDYLCKAMQGMQLDREDDIMKMIEKMSGIGISGEGSSNQYVNCTKG